MKRTVTAVPASTVKSTTAKSSRSNSPGIPNTHLFLLPCPSLPFVALRRPRRPLPCVCPGHWPSHSAERALSSLNTDSAQTVQAACGSTAAWS